MRIYPLLALAILAQYTNSAYAAITPAQLRQIVANTIQCEQKSDGSEVSLTFENCQDLDGDHPSCDVMANTDDDSKKLLTLQSYNTSYTPNDPQLSTLLDISDGNNDDSPWGPSLIYDRDCLMINKDGSGFFYHQRNNGSFWDILSPLNEHMDFQNCRLTTNQ